MIFPSRSLKHVNMLNFEMAARGLDTDEQAAVIRYPTDAQVCSAKHTAHRDPLGFGKGLQDSKPNVRERALNVLENDEHSCATNGATVVTDVYELEAYHVRS